MDSWEWRGLGRPRAALLARYKVPEQVVLVASLPRNAMGKVERGPLCQLFEEN
jgi:non-ribosomal peptide synthetase component E (peptide arylation enzyme)